MLVFPIGEESVSACKQMGDSSIYHPPIWTGIFRPFQRAMGPRTLTRVLSLNPLMDTQYARCDCSEGMSERLPFVDNSVFRILIKMKESVGKS